MRRKPRSRRGRAWYRETAQAGGGVGAHGMTTCVCARVCVCGPYPCPRDVHWGRPRIEKGENPAYRADSRAKLFFEILGRDHLLDPMLVQACGRNGQSKDKDRVGGRTRVSERANEMRAAVWEVVACGLWVRLTRRTSVATGTGPATASGASEHRDRLTERADPDVGSLRVVVVAR